MNIDLIWTIAITLLLLVMALMILIGKGDWMISMYRRLNSEERAKVNHARLRLTNGLTLIYVAIALPIIVALNANDYIAMAIILPPAIIATILTYTWCRRR